MKIFREKQKQLELITEILNERIFTPKFLNKQGLDIKLDGKKRNGFELLKYTTIDQIKNIIPEIASFKDEVIKQIAIEGKYQGYLKRQRQDIELFKRDENIIIPDDFDYMQIASLSNEVKEKLSHLRPRNIGMASRISGITPVSIIAILVKLRQINN